MAARCSTGSGGVAPEIGAAALALSVAQRPVVQAFLDEREVERRHLVVALSGAHAYGFPSPDSDVDLKCVHVAPIGAVLALEAPPSVADRIEVRDGVELDYGSNEIGAVLTGVLRGNGNYVERLLGGFALRASPDLASLAPLVRANLSQRFYRHYHGFASGQRKAAEESCTAKRVLYVLRTALTGAHLLRTGEVVTDLTALAGPYGLDVTALVEAKSRGERQVLDASAAASARGLMDAAFRVLDVALAESSLPEHPVDPGAFDAWLLATRARSLPIVRPVRRALDVRRDTILLVVGGSRAYGLARAGSDVDVRGVAIPPAPYLHGLAHKFEQAEGDAMAVFADTLSDEERLVSGATRLEGTVYDVRKFLTLATESNPNILDVLFCRDDEVRVCTPLGARLRTARDLFVTASARHTFAGYAAAQLKRIQGHRRWLLTPPTHAPTRAEYGLPESTLLPREQVGAAEAAIRKQLERWDLDTNGLEPAGVVALQTAIARSLAEIRTALGFESDDGMKWLAAARVVGLDANLIHVLQKEREFDGASRQWRHYLQWKTERNPARAALEASHGYDTKHAAHLVRLLRMGREILETGRVWVWRGPGGAADADELRAIRDGAWTYDRLLEEVSREEAALAAIMAGRRFVVPAAPDRVAIDTLCQDLVEDALSAS